MKIAILGPSKKFLSGVSYYTIRLSNALSNHVDVQTILFRHMLPKRLFPGWRRVGENLTDLEFDRKVEVYEILDWYSPITWFKAHRIASLCDAIILQWWTSSVSHMYLAIELMNKLHSKLPIIVEFHEVVDPLESSILPIKAYSKIMGRLIRNLATHYVVHSHADLKVISETYSIPPEKISIIPHGIYDHYPKIDRDMARKTLGINEDFVILFFGLLRPYKGVRYLIKAFEELPDDIINNSRLLIVGETWEDQESVRIARESTHAKKITLINRYIPDNEVSLYFSASDVVVLPYTRASQSGVAHIAMSLGLPIIATQVGGLVESLGKYAGTRFVKPMDVNTLRRALMDVFMERGHYTPPADLTWENIAMKWINLLNLAVYNI